MRKRAGLLAAGSVVSLLAVLCLTPGAATQHVKNMAAGDQPQKRGAETATITSVLAGRWTYRSFVNDPDVARPFNDLRFGAGEMTIESAEEGRLRGRLDFGPDFQLA